MKVRRPRRALVALLAAISIAGASAALLPPAPASALPARPAAPALPRDLSRLCPAPRPGHATCESFVVTTKRHLAVRRAASSTSTTLMQAPYTPAALEAAYNLPSLVRGRGQTVAIVDAYDNPTLESDLAVYRSVYGLPPCTTANGCFQKLNQLGQQGNYPSNDSGWAGEEALDVEMVSAICPLCRILVVEANSETNDDLNVAENAAIAAGAHYISNSWGSTIPIAGLVIGPWISHPGVIITASAGDYGYGVLYPAAYTKTVAVGGTSLLPAANGRGWSEIAWSGTGSGCSQEYKPAWQADTGCAGRTVADVSAVADPYTGVNVYDSDPNGPTMGWGELGGTSVSSPIIAALYALGGPPSPSAPAPGSGASGLYASASMLNDIVAGTNTLDGCTPAYLCTAGPGYDGPTGMGTPDGVSAFISAPRGRYTIMGDSYSAGEGDYNYDPGTDVKGTNMCHRSPWAFGRLFASAMGFSPLHIACSGAVTSNVMTSGQYNEPSQLSQLDPQSALVSISIGGNDAGFADVMKYCVAKAALYLSCQSHYTQNDSNNLHNNIDALRPVLASVYTAIKNRAPSAMVVAVNYPNFFNRDGTSCQGIGNLSKSDILWLWSETEHMDDVVVAAARDAGVLSLDVRGAFVGHAACDADPYVVPIAGLAPPNPADNWDIVAWLHPNLEGQRQMESYLTEGIGPLLP